MRFRQLAQRERLGSEKRPVTLISGTYLGPYRLLNLLMTGQSSEVWEVVHDAKQQRFALKALLPDFTNDREHRGYLQNEFMVGKSPRCSSRRPTAASCF
jgi:hypothetical protein